MADKKDKPDKTKITLSMKDMRTKKYHGGQVVSGKIPVSELGKLPVK